MKCRIRPITYALNQTMLYWIVMNVIKMPLKIFFITNRMLPKTSLPNRPFIFLDSYKYDGGGGYDDGLREYAYPSYEEVRLCKQYPSYACCLLPTGDKQKRGRSSHPGAVKPEIVAGSPLFLPLTATKKWSCVRRLCMLIFINCERSQTGLHWVSTKRYHWGTLGITDSKSRNTIVGPISGEHWKTESSDAHLNAKWCRRRWFVFSKCTIRKLVAWRKYY